MGISGLGRNRKVGLVSISQSVRATRKSRNRKGNLGKSQSYGMGKSGMSQS